MEKVKGMARIGRMINSLLCNQCHCLRRIILLM